MPEDKTFDCGCVWHYMASKFTVTCREHGLVRPADCKCLNPGTDDGQQTCWQHHDCQRGDCTHQE